MNFIVIMAKSCILQFTHPNRKNSFEGVHLMKLVKTLLALIILAALGGGIYLGTADIEIPQKTITVEVTPE